MRLKSCLVTFGIAAQFLTAACAEEKSAIARSIQNLTADQSGSRSAAAEALGKAGSSASEAVPALLKILQSDADTVVRNQAAWALGKIKGLLDQTIPGLISALDDKEWTVRHNATLALTWIGKPALPALKAALSSKSAMQQVYGARALSIIDPSLAAEAIPVLMELLRHELPGVKKIAAAAIAPLGETASSAVPGLVAMLDDKDAETRGYAIKALAQIGRSSESALPRLIKLLKEDSDKINRFTCTGALGLLGKGNPGAIEALVGAFNDKDGKVRFAAAKALGELGEPAVPALLETLKSNAGELRSLAVSALGAMGPKAVTAAHSLVPCLDDADEHLRVIAADALRSIGVADDDVKKALEKVRDKAAPGSPARAHFDNALTTLAANKQSR
jgi:HEAT repeat protein